VIETLDALDALVVGAGISGLTTAFRLAHGGWRVAVVEAAGRVGGAMETWTDGPWRFELGPNTVVENHETVGRLIGNAGLEGEKIVAAPSAKRRYLYKDGRLIPLPSGPGSFLTTPLFSPGAKLRLLKEPWIGRPPERTEESIAGFTRRRLGQSFLDYAVGPFASGIYAGDPERLSVRWAVPRIWSLERDHGSLFRGAFARRKGPSPGGAMISFRDGLETLPRKLAAEIGDVRTGVAVQRIVRMDPIGGGYRAETSAGPIEAKHIVLAVPADAAARLLDEATAGASRLFEQVPYAAVAILALGWRRVEVGHSLAGFGFLVPRKEGLRTLGCLFPSELFPGCAPRDHVALAAFAGGRTDPGIVTWDEDRIAATLIDELRGPLSIRGEPAFRLVRRWPRAIPQYEIGHGRFLDRAREIEQALPGLHIGGNFLGGISVPNCIQNSTELAERMILDDTRRLPIDAYAC
jgi:protoporphyrinogen/coproporphyrinogen III oxidase